MKLAALIGTSGLTALTIPSSTTSSFFNATQQLEDAHINYKHFLIGTRAGSRLPDYVGPRLADKWDTMGKLYKKYDAEGRLDTAEMREFGMVRKLLQLANLVRGTQKNQYYFERYCFYGCHCLPGLTAHDSTAGKGAPQDSIDGTCSHLRQCYLCANKETDGECDGTTMSYSWKFEDFDNDGKADEITCTNTPGTCRWKLCQCDRQFALQLRDHEDSYNEELSIGQDGTGFDREGQCQAGGGGSAEKACCGNYQTNFRLIFSPGSQECCDNNTVDVPQIKPVGECENPSI